MGKESKYTMKTEAKTVRVIPYGRLGERIEAFASDSLAPLRVSKTWRSVQQTDELWHLLIAFSDELNDAFMRTFRERATSNTRLLVLNDSHSSDMLLSRIVSLQIRSTHRLCIVDPPFAESTEKKWDDLILLYLGRLTAGLESNESDGRIFDAHLENGFLHVVSVDFRRLEIPIAKIVELAEAEADKAKDFEIDDDGSYLYWPSLDIHLGWEQLEQIVDPLAALKAKKKSHGFNQRYGAAIRKVREEKGLPVTAIPELSVKQLRRIETGDCRLTSNAAQKLAAAHNMNPNEYLQAIATALD
jgi:hypothetical protein